MSLQAEWLPPEIWLYIFSFIEGHDLVQAFSHLNSFFDSLLRSQHLQLHIRIQRNESNERLPQAIWSHIQLQNIFSLSVGRRTANCLIQFLRWHARHLIRLRTVPIYLRKSNIYHKIQHISLALQQLPSLNCIRIKCSTKFDSGVDAMEPLMMYVFSNRNNIQKCSFVFDMSNYNMITSNWSINSSLKYLDVVPISWNNLVILLSYAPQLYSLRANIVESHESEYENFVFNHLKMVDLRLHGQRFSQLQMIKTIAPNIQSLQLSGIFNVKDNDYFNENLWHKLFENIKYYHVNLKNFQYGESEKICLRNRIRDYDGKNWFSWNEPPYLLAVNIKFKSTTI
jgi:hypothetical protein